mgnify:CR=1 FL=1
MNLDEMGKENIAVTRKILFLSYRRDLYEKFCFCLAGQHDILYHRIRDKDKDSFPACYRVGLSVIEMLRFTERSAEWIHSVRKKQYAPILFISGAQMEKTRKEESVRAVKSGADGYLSSIQSIEEMVAEAEALIRLQERAQKCQEVWEYQELKLIPDTRQAFLKEKEILLTRMEFDIVYYLASQNGRAVPYKELYEAVWNEEYLLDDASIMAHIHRIRLKLEKGQEKSFYIQNVYGIGYRFGCGCTQKRLLKKAI